MPTRNGDVLKYVEESMICSDVDKEFTTSRSYSNITGACFGPKETDYAKYLDAGQREQFKQLRSILQPDETMIVDLSGPGMAELPSRCYEEALELLALHKTWILTLYGAVVGHIDDLEDRNPDGSYMAFLPTNDDYYPWLRVRVWQINGRWVSQVFYNAEDLLQLIPTLPKTPTFAFNTSHCPELITVFGTMLISVDQMGNVIDYRQARHKVNKDEEKHSSIWVVDKIYAERRIFALTGNGSHEKVQLGSILRYEPPPPPVKEESVFDSFKVDSRWGFVVFLITMILGVLVLIRDLFFISKP